MDLLLDLAERQRLDLGRISILQLAEQFATAMNALEAVVPLNRRGDWLVMATRLVQLRSQTLLAASAEEHDAVRKAAIGAEAVLLERLRMRGAADWLDRQPQLSHDVFARPPQPGNGVAREADLLGLLEGVLLVMDGPRQPPVLPERCRPVLFRPWPVAEARARVLALLEQRRDQPERLSLLDCLPPALADDTMPRRALRHRAALSSVFCAALELEKDGLCAMSPQWKVPTVRRV
nr:segregation/condensation protein A [Endobacter medicaginis]